MKLFMKLLLLSGITGSVVAHIPLTEQQIIVKHAAATLKMLELYNELFRQQGLPAVFEINPLLKEGNCGKFYVTFCTQCCPLYTAAKHTSQEMNADAYAQFLEKNITDNTTTVYTGTTQTTFTPQTTVYAQPSQTVSDAAKNLAHDFKEGAQQVGSDVVAVASAMKSAVLPATSTFVEPIPVSTPVTTYYSSATPTTYYTNNNVR